MCLAPTLSSPTRAAGRRYAQSRDIKREAQRPSDGKDRAESQGLDPRRKEQPTQDFSSFTARSQSLLGQVAH
ncbi:hypothetical protein BU16DRAFT_529356 [Lophium mytilinum]|uniref:Uncharacterized protein n=1 Tax=Lophium mytilinum TaxID=390894 RepID=A0A6A6QIC0_9PEZI|nr:hypothetical protein BU16DRAFT_529356 [Lophium mytilinum]